MRPSLDEVLACFPMKARAIYTVNDSRTSGDEEEFKERFLSSI